MTPGARLSAAIEVLEQAFAAPLPADAILEAYFRRRRYAGSGDRTAVRERVYGILRRRARLEWALERAGASPSPRLLELADLIVGDGLDADEAERLFASSRHAPEALADAERRAAAALQGCGLEDSSMPDWVRFEYPEWLDRSSRATFGPSLAAEMAALNTPAPLDLRVNIAKASREEALAALRAEKIAAEPTALSPWGVRVADQPRTRSSGTRHAGRRAFARRAPNIDASDVFKQGWIEVQDEGSQVAAALVGARPGMTVVDYCAGAGGKTLALAALMMRAGRLDGRLIAGDASAERLERMTERLARAGVAGVRRVVVDEDSASPPELAEAADRVLVDAPCSGSGAWRRDPLAKWRLDAARLADLVARQGRILAAAARLVRPGGRLIYVTCSILPEENEMRITSFLDHDRSFGVVPLARVWRETLGGKVLTENRFLRLTPASTGTDGFFVAVLERRAPSG
jgi:16S rRNA (cytosine967-C5)-methyltransferase